MVETSFKDYGWVLNNLCLMLVVYFNQLLGAYKPKTWAKFTFLAFSALLSYFQCFAVEK